LWGGVKVPEKQSFKLASEKGANDRGRRLGKEKSLSEGPKQRQLGMNRKNILLLFLDWGRDFSSLRVRQ